jgi:hypothetical protein
VTTPERDYLQVEFPLAPPNLPMRQFASALLDLAQVYEVAGLLALQGYEEAPFPRQLRLRRRPLLHRDDELLMTGAGYGSPLQLILGVWGAAWPVLQQLPALISGGYDAWAVFIDREHSRRRLEWERATSEGLDNVLKRIQIVRELRDLAAEASATANPAEIPFGDESPRRSPGKRQRETRPSGLVEPREAWQTVRPTIERITAALGHEVSAYILEGRQFALDSDPDFVLGLRQDEEPEQGA